MWKQVFPEYAVKQVFNEFNVEREDELVISAMQSDLLSRCLVSLLKPALLHCIHNKRKFINEADLNIGKILNIFPYKDAPVGSLIDAREFVCIVEDHIQLCVEHIRKSIPTLVVCDYKMSQETMMILQLHVESCIRGFVYYVGGESGSATYRSFETAMANILGDSSYCSFDQGYKSFNKK